MLKKTFFLLTTVILLGCPVLLAQSTTSNAVAKSTTKYFINQLEIAPQSIQYLKVKDIDSIREYHHTIAGADTAVVLYTSKQDSLETFDDVMDDYFVVPEARSFKVNTPNYTNVEEPYKMVFSIESVSRVNVYRSDGTNPGTLYISSQFDFRDGDPKIKKKMMELIDKFNNLPKSR
jgi:hypothetical protein